MNKNWIVHSSILRTKSKEGFLSIEFNFDFCEWCITTYVTHLHGGLQSLRHDNLSLL